MQHCQGMRCAVYGSSWGRIHFDIHAALPTTAMRYLWLVMRSNSLRHSCTTASERMRCAFFFREVHFDSLFILWMISFITEIPFRSGVVGVSSLVADYSCPLYTFWWRRFLPRLTFHSVFFLWRHVLLPQHFDLLPYRLVVFCPLLWFNHSCPLLSYNTFLLRPFLHDWFFDSLFLIFLLWRRNFHITDIDFRS